MRRISTPTAAQDLFGPGKHGFRNGDPANAILATRLQAEWFNALQEEICSVVEQAGFALDSGNNSQLAAAIVQLIQSNTIDTLNTLRVDVPSATTVNLTTAAPNTRHINITGTTAITGFTVAAGRCYFVRFAGALTLTNGASLVTQTGANIVTASGDTCILRAIAADAVEILCYSAVGAGKWIRGSQQIITLGGLITVPHGLGYKPDEISVELVCTAANLNWSVGDIAPVGTNYFSQSFPNGDGLFAYADSANVYIRIGNTGVAVMNKTTGQVDRITTANWRVVPMWKRNI